jgi:hypothetical protein
MYGRASSASAIVVMDLDDADVRCQMPMSLPRLFMEEKKIDVQFIIAIWG